MTNLHPVAEWLSMSQDQVLDKFHGLKGAYSDGEFQERFVFIPGTRDDRVLFVAHADTVWLNAPIKLGFHDGIFYSKNRCEGWNFTYVNGSKIHKTGLGIGADDRAGCSLVWELREFGHSILITSGEEQGLIGTKRIMQSDWWKDHINTTHSFAIQFDRRERSDIVFYDIGTTDFAKYVQENTGYKPKSGTSTDIREICKLICGVNISVGYYSEHQPEERLVLDHYLNTLETCKHWLSQPNIPHWPLDRTKLFKIEPSYSANYHYRGHPHGYCDPYESYENEKDYGYGNFVGNNRIGDNPVGDIITSTTNSILSKISVNNTVVEDEKLQCPHCKTLLTLEEWFYMRFKCKNCNKNI